MIDKPDPFGDAFTSHLARRLASDCKRAVDIAANAHPSLDVLTIWHEAARAGTVVIARDGHREQIDFRPGVSRREVVRRVSEMADRMDIRPVPARDVDTTSETALTAMPYGKHEGKALWRVVQVDYAYATWAANNLENEVGEAFARYLAAMDPRPHA